MLATRISFMNEFANLAERLGADIERAPRHRRRSAHRLPLSLPGRGLWRLLFPKDVQALMCTASESGLNLLILGAVKRNAAQKQVLGEKIVKRLAPT